MSVRDDPPPITSDSTIIQEARWREMHDLAMRGISHPHTLSAGQMSMISSLALLALDLAGRRSAQAGRQPDQQTR